MTITIPMIILIISCAIIGIIIACVWYRLYIAEKEAERVRRAKAILSNHFRGFRINSSNYETLKDTFEVLGGLE